MEWFQTQIEWASQAPGGRRYFYPSWFGSVTTEEPITPEIVVRFNAYAQHLSGLVTTNYRHSGFTKVQLRGGCINAAIGPTFQEFADLWTNEFNLVTRAWRFVIRDFGNAEYVHSSFSVYNPNVQTFERRRPPRCLAERVPPL